MCYPGCAGDSGSGSESDKDDGITVDEDYEKSRDVEVRLIKNRAVHCMEMLDELPIEQSHPTYPQSMPA